MKILWITKTYSNKHTGGTIVSYNYIKTLKSDNEVTILSIKNDIAKISFLKSYISFYRNLYQSFSQPYDYVFFDDHLSALALLFPRKKTIYFYHGNWPALLFTSITFFIKGIYLFPMCLIGMMFSNYVIFVNPYYQNLYKYICRNTLVLLNPVVQKNDNTSSIEKDNTKNKIILVGNIDARKYVNLIDFLRWGKEKLSSFEFDLYGKVIDKNIEKQLRLYGVNIKGFVSKIPYKQYSFHMSFSKAENLPLSLFEALSDSIPCIYPFEKNYLPFQNKEGFFLYKDFNQCLEILFSKSLVHVDNSYIPKSYEANILSLFNYINK